MFWEALGGSELSRGHIKGRLSKAQRNRWSTPGVVKGRCSPLGYPSIAFGRPSAGSDPSVTECTADTSAFALEALSSRDELHLCAACRCSGVSRLAAVPSMVAVRRRRGLVQPVGPREAVWKTRREDGGMRETPSLVQLLILCALSFSILQRASQLCITLVLC